MAHFVSLNRLYRYSTGDNTGHSAQRTGHRAQQRTGYRNRNRIRLQQRNSATAMDEQQQRNSITAQRATATATAIQPQLHSTGHRAVGKAKKIGMRIWIWHPPLLLSIGFRIGGHRACHHTTQTLWVSNIFLLSLLSK
jgi:hypothetical protein